MRPSERMARLDFNKKEDVEKISGRIRTAYKKFSGGLGDPDDCVQEILTRMCEGKHQHSTIDQAVIDYLRSNYGDARVYTQDEMRNLNHADSLEPGDIERLERLDIGGESPCRLDFDECAGWIRNQVDRGCLGLFYKWGLNEAEIGHLFGFSKSRVSQRLERVQKCISARVKAKEPRVTEKNMAKVLCQKTEGILRGVEQVSREKMESDQSWVMESFDDESF